MTHDELLAEIKREIKQCSCFPGNCEDENNRPWNAICAVVELHRPEEQDHKQYEKCWNCNLLYPCPTIQAIEKELING